MLAWPGVIWELYSTMQGAGTTRGRAVTTTGQGGNSPEYPQQVLVTVNTQLTAGDNSAESRATSARDPWIHVQLFGTPWTVATWLLCPWGFSRQGYRSGLPFSFPRDLPNPGIEPRSPTLQADSLPAELPGKDWREAAFNPVVIRPGPQ